MPANTPNNSNSADPGLDAFGRQRNAEPFTLFDSKQLFDSQPLYWDTALTGTGSSTFNANQSSTTLAVTGGGVGSVIRQTFRRFAYQPGKSLAVYMTGILIGEGGTGQANVTRRIGLFDTNNGLFFQISGTTMSVVVRSFTSGAPVDTVITQSNWSIDRLDGTGPSGVTIDFSKVQIFHIDFQWLGTGRVRFGMNVGGTLLYCHEQNAANTLTLVYMQYPNLPLRYEIVSTVAHAASVLHICTTVVSNGGREDTGLTLGVDTAATGLTTGNNILIYGLLFVRLQATKQAATINPLLISVLSNTANATYRFGLILNPTIAGVLGAFAAVANSALEVAQGVVGNTLTNGTTLLSIYDAGGNKGSIVQDTPTQLTIGASIAGVSDIMALYVQPTPAQGLAFLGSFNWLEID